MNEILSSIVVPFVTALGGGFITWLFTRKKSDAETLQAQVNAADTLRLFYQKLLDDGANHLDKAIAKLQEKEATIEGLIQGIKERDQKIEQLIREIEKLTIRLKKDNHLNIET